MSVCEISVSESQNRTYQNIIYICDFSVPICMMIPARGEPRTTKLRSRSPVLLISCPITVTSDQRLAGQRRFPCMITEPTYSGSISALSGTSKESNAFTSCSLALFWLPKCFAGKKWNGLRWVGSRMKYKTQAVALTPASFWERAC